MYTFKLSLLFLLISVNALSQLDSSLIEAPNFKDFLGIQLKSGTSKTEYNGSGHTGSELSHDIKTAYELIVSYDWFPRSAIEIGFRSSGVEQSLLLRNLQQIEDVPSYSWTNSYDSRYNEIPLAVTLKLLPIKRYSSISLLTGYSYGWLSTKENLPSTFKLANRDNLHALYLGARVSIKLHGRLYLNADVRKTAVVTDMNKDRYYTSKLEVTSLLVGVGYKFGQCD